MKSKYFQLLILLSFFSQGVLLGEHPIVILIGHSRSCSTILERCMYERGDLVTMHEPFSFQYFKERDLELIDSLSLFQESYYTKTSSELFSKINSLSLTSPVFIKELAIGCNSLFEKENFINKKNVFFILLMRHPVKTLNSLFSLDEDYPDMLNEYKALFEVLDKLKNKKKVFTIRSENFCKNPEFYLKKISEWSGLKYVQNTSKFKKDPPQAWRYHTKWCKKAISSVTIENSDAQYTDDDPNFSSDDQTNKKWLEALKISIMYYDKLLKDF